MAPGSPAWEVTAQREDYQVDPTTGQAVQGMLVTFKTAAGGYGTVFVAKGDYTTERVRQAIAEHARTIDAVGALKG